MQTFLFKKMIFVNVIELKIDFEHKKIENINL